MIKKYKEFFEEYFSGDLKNDLVMYYLEHESDYDPEETENVIEILDGLNDDLSNITKWDKVLLLRIIQDDQQLYDRVDEIEIPGEDIEFL